MILYAIPTPLGGAPQDALPAPALATIRSLQDFVVENAKSARAFLGALGVPVRGVNIAVIDEKRDLLSPLREGRPLGLLSEAGCPAIAGCWYRRGSSPEAPLTLTSTPCGTTSNNAVTVCPEPMSLASFRSLLKSCAAMTRLS